MMKCLNLLHDFIFLLFDVVLELIQLNVVLSSYIISFTFREFLLMHPCETFKYSFVQFRVELYRL